MRTPGSHLWTWRSLLPAVIVVSVTIWLWWLRMEERSVKVKRLPVPRRNESHDARKSSQEDVVIEKVAFRDVSTSPANVHTEEKIYYAPCPALKNNASVKNILLYTPFFGQKDWGLGEDGKELFEKYRCDTCQCSISRKRSSEFTEIEAFDAVLFHLENMSKDEHLAEELNKLRRQDQRFIMFLMESPLSTHFKAFTEFRSFFNWTMTYRRDSDIVASYGRIQPIVPGFQIASVPKPFIPHQLTVSQMKSVGRRKSVLWFVSHCHTYSKRESYVDELSKYIEVDTFGTCGQKGCERASDCETEKLGEYKFYLSFENSMCADYVTEKFFDRLAFDIVPIVMGNLNYSEIAPPHSYIDVRDFKDPKSLAGYLHHLNSHPEEYLAYFWWKQHYEVVKGEFLRSQMCQLCDLLHHPERNPPKVVEDLKDWLFEDANGDPVCWDRIPWAHYLPVFDSERDRRTRPLFFYFMATVICASSILLFFIILIVHWVK